MTPIVQHPADWHIGFLHVSGFGFAMMLAFAVAHWVAQHVLTQRGDDPEIMNDVTFAALIGTILGAKTYLAILTGNYRVFFSTYGFVFWGGFMGAVVLCWLVIRWRRASFLRIADACGVGIGAGYAIGRTGCWAVGDDFGRVYSGPLAVAFPQGLPPTTVATMNAEYHANLPATMAPDAIVGVIPTQLIEVILGFVMFMILWRFRRHAHRSGWLFGLYCVLAGVERFLVEFFRAKSDMVGPVTSAQVVAIGIAAVGVVLLASRRSPAPALAAAH